MADVSNVGEPVASILAIAVVTLWFFQLARDWRGGSPELRFIREMWAATAQRDEEIVRELRNVVAAMRRNR